jgi:hypothetical protein
MRIFALDVRKNGLVVPIRAVEGIFMLFCVAHTHVVRFFFQNFERTCARARERDKERETKRESEVVLTIKK